MKRTRNRKRPTMSFQERLMRFAAQAPPVCGHDLVRSLRRSTNVATFLLFCRKSRHDHREISLKLMNISATLTTRWRSHRKSRPRKRASTQARLETCFGER